MFIRPRRSRTCWIAPLLLLGAALGGAHPVCGETWAERLGFPAGAKVIVLHANALGMCYETNAAGTVSLAASLLGLAADVPAGTVTASPVAPWPLGATTVTGLRAGDRPLSVAVDAAGVAEVTW